MKLIPTLIAALLLLPLNCCALSITNKNVKATGPDVTGTVNVKSVTEIQTSQGITVNYTVGSPVSVCYSVPESLSEYLEISCSNGRLKCKFEDGISVQLNGRKVKVDVIAPKVAEFDVTSGATINVKGQLTVNELEADASSGGSIQMASVKAKAVELDASSAASISISDLNSEAIEIDSTSGASINLNGTMGNVELETSSGAEAKISGSCNVLKVQASSGASVDATRADISTGKLKSSSGASIAVSEAKDTPFQTSKSSGGSIKIR